MSEITFSAYDERMRPMFERLARLVVENGQEAEYATLAESIDAPTLEDLGFPEERCGTVNVPYRVTIVYEGEVTVHVDNLTEYINDGINEGDFFSTYGDDIEEAIRNEGLVPLDGGGEFEIEPHPSDYVSTGDYCD